MENDEKHIGKNIYELRRLKGLSQEELGKKTYTSRSTVSLWERGEKDPSEEEIKLLSHALEVSIDRIFSGEELGSTAETDMNNPIQDRMIESAETLEVAQGRMTQAIDSLLIQNRHWQQREERRKKDRRDILEILAIALMIMIVIFLIFFCNTNQPKKDGSLKKGSIAIETSNFLDEGGHNFW